MEDRADAREPGPGQIRVAVHGSSLNFHDMGVVLGRMRAEDGQIPLADGAAWSKVSAAA
jgi:NADPH:quinone reductase-like Zn-dependent oxidoreductase